MMWGIGAIFLCIALCYAGVGLGGGSAYLAVLSLLGWSRETIVPLALLCNLAVSGTSAYWYTKAGHFRRGLFLPFAIAGVPAAFVGARLPLSPRAFALLLGGSLLLASLRLLIGDRLGRQRAEDIAPPRRWLALGIGAALGLLAGLVGIGGGIFLIPILLLLGWAGPKEAAAVGAWFVVVNSAAGLAGFVSRGGTLTLAYPLLLAAVMIGSQLGGRLGARVWSPRRLRHVMALILSMAGVQLLWRFL